MADTTRKYEGLFLFGTASTADVDAALSIVRTLVGNAGGTPHVLKKWDDRKLAYEVDKNTRGLYVLTFFDAPTTAVAEIERAVRLGTDVLRCLITDAGHLSAAEVEAMEPQKPEPKPELDDEGNPIRPRRDGGEGDEVVGEDMADQQPDEGDPGEGQGTQPRGESA